VNIKENNKASIAVFDSQQLIGEGVGLQIEGQAEELGIKDIPSVAAIYFKRNYPFGKMRSVFDEALKSFLERKIYRFYKFTPVKIWINNPNSDIDERIEVN